MRPSPLSLARFPNLNLYEPRYRNTNSDAYILVYAYHSNYLADTKDEIDIEILGSDPSHFQTNIFTPTPEDPDPHYATLFSIQPVPGGDVTKRHEYTVEWTEDRIVWGVDGREVKVVEKGQYFRTSAISRASPSRLPSVTTRQIGFWGRE
jgi:hypothetical protein